MKTCLFTLSYLDGEDFQGNNRLERNIRYIKYYSALKDELGFDKIIFSDNGSSEYSKNKLTLEFSPHCWSDDLSPYYMICLVKHLRRKSTFDYPYAWRGLYTMDYLIDMGYEKIILIDSDCFVLTKKAAKFIKAIEKGWTSFWCEKYQFPETAIQILCQDSFSRFKEFIEAQSWQDRSSEGKAMELLLPFTGIHGPKYFQCDRWGETRAPQHDWMDIYCQANLDTPLRFHEGK